jgi:hypothetical protein
VSQSAEEACDPIVAEATDEACDPIVAEATDEACDKIDEACDKSAQACDTQDVALDGFIDGSHDGTEPPYPPKREQPPPRRITDGRDKALAKIRHINQTARSPAAHKIVAAYSDSLPVPIDPWLQAEIGVQVDHCLIGGINAPAIAIGLHAWTHSDSWSPTQIPKFVHKANNGRHPSTADERVRQAQALKARCTTTTGDWSPFAKLEQAL